MPPVGFEPKISAGERPQAAHLLSTVGVCVCWFLRKVNVEKFRGLTTLRFITVLTRDRLSTLYLTSLCLLCYLLLLGLRVGFTIKVPNEFVH